MIGREVERGSKPLLALLSDEPQGGAAISANRLAAGLAQLGARVERWYCSHETLPGVPFAQVPLERHRKRPWPERLLRNISRRLGARLRHRRHERLLYAEVAARRPALLHLHNLHASGLTHDSLLDLPPNLPLVWTLHDCAAVAPHCYEWQMADGRRMTIGPDAAGPAEAPAARVRFFAACPGTVLVSPSRWLENLARSVVPQNIRVERIPYGLPCERFKPIPSSEARGALGLPESAKLLGFAATAFDLRKGGDVFSQAVLQANLPGCEVVVWGDDSRENWPAGITWRRFGRVTDEQQMVRLYSACDLFVCPSRMDNLPNTILESLACGTPVVASAVGGIPDLVRPGLTGWLYERNEPSECALALRQAFADQIAWPAYGERCRNVAVNEFSLEIQARSYLRLYEQLLQSHSTPAP